MAGGRENNEPSPFHTGSILKNQSSAPRVPECCRTYGRTAVVAWSVGSGCVVGALGGAWRLGPTRTWVNPLYCGGTPLFFRRYRLATVRTAALLYCWSGWVSGWWVGGGCSTWVNCFVLWGVALIFRRYRFTSCTVVLLYPTEERGLPRAPSGSQQQHACGKPAQHSSPYVSPSKKSDQMFNSASGGRGKAPPPPTKLET